MTNDTTERRLEKRAAHALRTAALRLALERSAGESDPTVAYGCVEWFRYDAPLQAAEPGTSAPPTSERHEGERDGSSLRH